MGEVIAVADALNWKTFTLLVRIIIFFSPIRDILWVESSLSWYTHLFFVFIHFETAGAFPARIEKLIVCDAFLGPINWRRTSAPDRLHKHLKENPRFQKRQRRIYPTFEDAVKKYLSRVQMLPDSGRLLLKRGTEEVIIGTDESNQKEEGEPSKDLDKERGFAFRHDPRLVGTPAFTLEGLHIFFFSINSIRIFCSRFFEENSMSYTLILCYE